MDIGDWFGGLRFGALVPISGLDSSRVENEEVDLLNLRIRDLDLDVNQSQEGERKNRMIGSMLGWWEEANSRLAASSPSSLTFSVHSQFPRTLDAFFCFLFFYIHSLECSQIVTTLLGVLSEQVERLSLSFSLSF